MGNHWCANCPQQDKGGSRSASGENFDEKDRKGAVETSGVTGETAAKLKDFKPVLEAYKSVEASSCRDAKQQQNQQQKGLRFINHGTRLQADGQHEELDTDYSDTAKLEPDDNDVVDIQQIAKDIVDINVFIASQVIYPALQRFREEKEEEKRKLKQHRGSLEDNGEGEGEERIRLINHNDDDNDDEDDDDDDAGGGSKVRFNVCNKKSAGKCKQKEDQVSSCMSNCSKEAGGVRVNKDVRWHNDNDRSLVEQSTDEMIIESERSCLLENVDCQRVAPINSNDCMSQQHEQQQQQQLQQQQQQQQQGLSNESAECHSSDSYAIHETRNGTAQDLTASITDSASNNYKTGTENSSIPETASNQYSIGGTDRVVDTTETSNVIEEQKSIAASFTTKFECSVIEPEEPDDTIPVIVENSDVSIVVDDEHCGTKERKEDLSLDFAKSQLKVSLCQVIIHSPDAPPAYTPIYEWPPPIPDYIPGTPCIEPDDVIKPSNGKLEDDTAQGNNASNEVNTSLEGTTQHSNASIDENKSQEGISGNTASCNNVDAELKMSENDKVTTSDIQASS